MGSLWTQTGRSFSITTTTCKSCEPWSATLTDPKGTNSASFELWAFGPCGEAMVTDSEVSSDRPNKPASHSDPLNKTLSDDEPPDQPASPRNFKDRFRVRLRLIGGALASIAA